MQQAAETLHSPTGPSIEVSKKVDIVAGLGEKHKGRAGLISPVDLHKRVGYVPTRDIFDVLDLHHFPDSSFPYQPVDLEEMRNEERSATHGLPLKMIPDLRSSGAISLCC